MGRSPGEGNGYPILYSCLEDSMNRRTWQARIHGVAKSQIGLSDEHLCTLSALRDKTWMGSWFWWQRYCVVGKGCVCVFVLIIQSTEVSEPGDRAGGRQIKARRIPSPSLWTERNLTINDTSFSSNTYFRLETPMAGGYCLGLTCHLPFASVESLIISRV